MNTRLVSGLIWLTLALGLGGRMLYEERIARPEERSATEATRQDRLLGELDYRKDLREKNMGLFGLSGGEQRRAVREIQDIEDAHLDRIRRMFAKADDPDALAEVFCGERVDLPSRYRAMAWLIDDKNERRQTINLGRSSRLELQEWAATSGIAEVYRELELGNDRQPDATIMGVAAILVGREQDVFDNNAPWGQGFAAQWSWSRVKAEHKGIEELVITYLATLHVMNEVAREEGGLCAS